MYETCMRWPLERKRENAEPTRKNVKRGVVRDLKGNQGNSERSVVSVDKFFGISRMGDD